MIDSIFGGNPYLLGEKGQKGRRRVFDRPVSAGRQTGWKTELCFLQVVFQRMITPTRTKGGARITGSR
jgi:hypothetical protein